MYLAKQSRFFQELQVIFLIKKPDVYIGISVSSQELQWRNALKLNEIYL